MVTAKISDETTDVLLESAAFNAPNIRHTVKQLGISTDSSYRFERGVDIEMVEYASERAAHLICEYTGGRIVSGMIDVRVSSYCTPVVNCRFDRVNQLLGVNVGNDKIVSIFENLGLNIANLNSLSCDVEIPSFRLDLAREADLIEEVARIYGFNSIPASKDLVKHVDEVSTDAYLPMQELRDQLITLGLCECTGYSMVSEHDAISHSGLKSEELISLTNPLNQEQAILRPSLISTMFEIVVHNLARGNNDLQLFELGRVFCSGKDKTEENYEICIGLTGKKYPESFSSDRDIIFDFYDIRGLVEDLFEIRQLEELSITKADHPVFKSGSSAKISSGSDIIGFIGEVTNKLVDGVRLKYPLFLASLNVNKLLSITSKPSIFNELPLYPAICRDVSFTADESLEHQEIKDFIRNVGVETLEKIEVADIYRDTNVLGDHKKSMVYTFTFRSSTGTLTDTEVNEAQEKIRLAMIDKLPIQIR